MLMAAGLAFSSFTSAQAQDASCEIDRPVMFAGLNYDSALFHKAVARFIIEKGYGCQTDALPGDVIPLLTGAGKGDIDVVMEIEGERLIDPHRREISGGAFIERQSEHPRKELRRRHLVMRRHDGVIELDAH